MLLGALRSTGVLGTPLLETPLFLLLASLLATLLVLTLRSEAGELQQRRQRRRWSGPAQPHTPADCSAARLQLWAGGFTLLGQLLAMGSKSELQAVFQAHPSERAAGLLFDVWQLLLGTRSLAMFVTAFIAPLPTLPHLALALLAFELPLLVPEQPVSCDARLDAADTAVAECRTFVTFFQLLCGVVLPTLIVARLHAPLYEAAAEEAERRRRRRLVRELSRPPSSDEEEREAAAAGGGRARRRQRCGWPLPIVQALGARLSALALSAEGTLQHLCGLLRGSGPDLAGSWVLTAAVWWLLLSFCWVLALALELVPAGPGSPALV
uniref:Uncharacterized protein n=1 Tax=Chlorella ohadii TaxID=2649997 RepID=A0AAD5DVJ6_9CHLO